MKYIRTKNEIIDLSKLDNFDINDRGDITWYNDTEKCGHMIEYEDIIKTADTIEELCDEFVIDGIYGHQVIHSYKEMKEVEFECIREGNYVEIYGAIWTDKGLIYVAKMNEKGDLELL